MRDPTAVAVLWHSWRKRSKSNRAVAESAYEPQLRDRHASDTILGVAAKRMSRKSLPSRHRVALSLAIGVMLTIS